MKRVIFNIFLLLMTLGNVFAQGTNKPEYYTNSGISFPTAPDEFTDYWKMGFNFGVGMGYAITSNLIFIGYFDFNRFKFDDSKFLKDYGYSGYGISISGGGVSIIMLSWDLKATLQTSSSQMRPYLCGGVGVFELSTSDVIIHFPRGSATVKGDSETTLSVLFGAGIDIAIGKKTDLFIEGKYAIGFTEGESTQILPVKLGIKFR